jgi:hypothetical protein
MKSRLRHHIILFVLGNIYSALVPFFRVLAMKKEGRYGEEESGTPM